MRLKNTEHSLKGELLETSEPAQHAYEEGRRMIWNETAIIHMETNNTYRKCKESAHMAFVINLISLEISPTLISLISKEVSNLQGSPILLVGSLHFSVYPP